MLAAIVFVATSGCTWQQLPSVSSASFGPSAATAHRRFTEWSNARVWAKLHRLVLDELGARGELDWFRRAGVPGFGERNHVIDIEFLR